MADNSAQRRSLGEVKRPRDKRARSRRFRDFG